jgi:hypothetical protein
MFPFLFPNDDRLWFAIVICSVGSSSSRLAPMLGLGGHCIVRGGRARDNRPDGLGPIDLAVIRPGRADLLVSER